MEATKQVVFKIGGEDYGLAITLVSAIESAMKVIPVPNTSKNVKGMINLRGEVVPVYSLHNKFGLQESLDDVNTRLIIVRVGEMLMAFPVDHMEGILEIEASQITEAPLIIKTNNTSYIDKVANVNGNLIILLNVDGILSDVEMKDMEEIVAKKED